jgi:hypothetical protein
LDGVQLVIHGVPWTQIVTFETMLALRESRGDYTRGSVSVFVHVHHRRGRWNQRRVFSLLPVFMQIAVGLVSAKAALSQ